MLLFTYKIKYNKKKKKVKYEYNHDTDFLCLSELNCTQSNIYQLCEFY